MSEFVFRSRVASACRIAGLVIVLSASAALAQDPVIRTTVQAVPVSVVATDSKGEPVRGLGIGSLRLRDNGVEQRIVTLEELRGEDRRGARCLRGHTRIGWAPRGSRRCFR